MESNLIQVRDSSGKMVELIDNYGVMNTPNAMKDADTGIFFARQLELRISKAFEIKYPQFEGRKLAPVNSEGGAWTDSILAEYFDKVGNAEWATGEDETFPRADIKGAEVRTPVRAIKTGFGYSWMEIQRAAHNKTDLQQRRVSAAIFSYEKKLDSVIWSGDAKVKIGGFLSDTSVPRANASADGTAGATTFASKSAQKIVDNINDCMAKPWLDSGMLHKPNRLLLPPEQFELISKTRYDDGSGFSGGYTILSWLLSNNRWFMNGAGEIVPVNKLKGGGPTAGADCMIAYEYNSENLELYIPYPQNFFPVQQSGFQFMVPSLGMTGGIVWRYPKSANIVEGI